MAEAKASCMQRLRSRVGRVLSIKTIAITEIVLGALTITTYLCPSPCSKIIFGALVLIFGVALLLKKPKAV